MTATAPTPFDTAGVTRGPDGVSRYDTLPESLVHMLRAQVDENGTGEALIEVGGERLSYREVWDRASRVAGGLRAAGVGRGDRVAIRLPNGINWALAFWGTQLAGAVAVPVNTRFTESEARYVIEDSGAAYVAEPESPLPDGAPYAVEDAAVEDVAAIFYTSGTTGFPKGAVTTHANFLSNCESCNRVRPVDTDPHPRTLISVPLFHVTGCNSQMLTATYLGGTSVIMPQFEVTSFLSTIERERIDWLTSVPAIHWLAINHPDFPRIDVSGVRMLSYGGAPIAPELVSKIKKAFPAARVGNGFGLTETSSLSTYLPHEYAADHADSVGFPVPVCDVRLDVLDDATGAGELLIRGPHVVRGYWNKPEATAVTFVDGWLHTGDVARIDEQGLVYIVDRAKDMINRGGENVYCVEVENALAGAPGVFEAAVVGVPDEVMGEKVGAVVVPAPGTGFDVHAMLEYLRERLADFKVPQYVAVRTEPLPRNPGGKILKGPLRRDTQWGQPVR
ncbi:class I adenylate-forming enzyme family protein [Gandjariella thermophila]|uniref:O-succinylbenzoic acid--CoA ligase n=1 Tax=Gandjariella thermophila TaxID=1931992 RepID=A0A4D4J4K9_9PSEU|nr:AMP-binding protein [Gandjariella thermophila]GDY29688.1 O-succinylbenzoic acid--CoA ligase [Gandjariella thermophila]